MKTIIQALLFAGFAFFMVSCGSSQADQSKEDKKGTEYGNSRVEVLYFHSARRCPTCLKIEEVAEEFVKTAYTDQDVKFYSINFDEDENRSIAEKYNVTWSSLFIASGERFEDLTDLAFQVVKTDPSELTGRMKSVIDVYLSTE